MHQPCQKLKPLWMLLSMALVLLPEFKYEKRIICNARALFKKTLGSFYWSLGE